MALEGGNVRIMREAVGVLTANFLNKAIKESRNTCIGVDCDPDIAGRYLCDEFYTVPKVSECDDYEKYMLDFVSDHKVDVVIPTLDDCMSLWSKNSESLREKGIYAVISPESTVDIFNDKWKAYEFFSKHGIPTPKTSLEQEYGLVKPREGRGSKGIVRSARKVDMTGCISQEVVSGTEYTIDVLCDYFSKPIYIVPRIRLGVRNGKSTGGVVVQNEEICKWIHYLCERITFRGPINVQCFIKENGDISFIEVNTRLGGGGRL
ncbi:MAG: ATP-grasp domain-containing protein [Tannerellaceae bacterium]|nr:ATP-grasp domain-containing protein [Tannerellaceae bacterium]